MTFLQFKPSILTLVFLLTFVSVSNQSCSAVIPAAAQSTINTLASTLPAYMNKARGVLTPELARQGDNILAIISEAAKLTQGGSSAKVSHLLNTLGITQLKPFLDLWKRKGSLDQATITSAIQGVSKTMDSLRKAVKK